MYFDSLWKDFSLLAEVEAICLAGSRTSNNYDDKSDYDLYIYCSKLPSEQTRKNILEKYCKYIEISNSFWELEDDCTLKDEVDIDILYRDLNNFELDLEMVVEKHQARNGYTTCMWHNLLNSKILYDKEGKFALLQKRFNVKYPLELKQNIINRNLKLLTGFLPSYDLQIKKAIFRKDYPSMNHRVSAFIESYFDIIFALNSLSHPGEKRMIEHAKQKAKILPENFEENIEVLYKKLFSSSEEIESVLETIINNLKKVLGETL